MVLPVRAKQRYMNHTEERPLSWAEMYPLNLILLRQAEGRILKEHDDNAFYVATALCYGAWGETC